LSWTANGTYPDVYQASNPSAPTFINNVMDRGVLDSNGNYLGLVRRTSLVSVNSNPGSFFYDSAATTIYVRTSDSRAVDSNVSCLLTGTTPITHSTTLNSVDRYFYAENLKCFGGSINVSFSNAGSFFLYYGFKDCQFSHATGTEASFYVTAKSRGYLRECQSWYNRDDGFDYNADDSFCLEWYCRGGENVWGGTAVNGSTSHNDSKVIRVGSDYRRTAGKNIQDIQNSITYNLRCVCGNSIGGASNDWPYATNSVVDGTTTNMWLIECQTISSKGYQNFANSVLNIYDGDIGNILTASNDDKVGSTLNILTESEVFES
jgi:hypothetical protein